MPKLGEYGFLGDPCLDERVIRVRNKRRQDKYLVEIDDELCIESFSTYIG